MIEQLRDIKRSIVPVQAPWWSNNGHLQTILGHSLSSTKLSHTGEKILIPLETEKEKIYSTYFSGKKKIVVYLFHGLGGSSEALYMQRTSLTAQKLGCHVFMTNHRGCGEGVGLATEPYHSGRAEDLSAVIAFGKKMLPDHFHVAIGFSLSANALLLLAAKVRAEILPDIAISVNAPINLEMASQKLCQGLSWIYNWRFLLDLRDYVKKNRKKDIHLLKGIFSLRTFDEVFTAPIGGFKNRDDYYQTCSSAQHLRNISIPTVLICAEDDPFIGTEDYQKAHLSENCVLHLEKKGGHMGYLTSQEGKYERWLDYALEKYLTGIVTKLGL